MGRWPLRCAAALVCFGGCTSLEGLSGNGDGGGDGGLDGGDAAPPSDDGGQQDAAGDGDAGAIDCDAATCHAVTLATKQQKPTNLTVGASGIAWSDCAAAVWVLQKSGGDPVSVGSFSEVRGVTSQADVLYVATPTAILKGSLLPNPPSPAPFGTASNIQSLFATSTALFYTDVADVRRCSLTACTDAGSFAAPQIDVLAVVAADEAFVYAYRPDKFSTQYRIDQTTGEYAELDAENAVSAIGAGGGSAYWAICTGTGCFASFPAAPTELIQVDRMKASAPHPIATFPQGTTISGIAVSGTDVYFTVLGTSSAMYKDGALYRIQSDGSAKTVLVPNLTSPYGLVLSGTELYWMSGGTDPDPLGNGCGSNTGQILRLER
jgi:hypothetical protein